MRKITKVGEVRKSETSLNEKGIVPKKSLGQNFLTSRVVPDWLVEASGLQAGEVVLEIGPGTGRLTSVLLEKGARVIAVETDKRAVIYLQEEFAQALKAGNLVLHQADMREVSLSSLGLKNQQFKVVANIPYYLSGFLLRTLLENTTQPSALTFLIQKELAHRIVRDKKESLLSLSVKAFGTPQYFKAVSRGHFYPKPKVDSAILQINQINRDNFKEITPEHFFALLHLGLGSKRKQLVTNLSQVYPRLLVEDFLNTHHLPLTIRGEDLPLKHWLALAKVLK